MADSDHIFAKLKEGLVWTFGINSLISAVNLLSSIWFARVLGISIIGQYASLVVALDLSLMLVKFGINQAVILRMAHSL
jgi:O-antigen/teichoic acid export membrane protein